MWVRGLKLVADILIDSFRKSHPMWVRGLKLSLYSEGICSQWVAPYVGAWIETPI